MRQTRIILKGMALAMALFGGLWTASVSDLQAQGRSFGIIPLNRSLTLGKQDSSLFYLRVDSVSTRGSDTVAYFPQFIDTSLVPGCAYRTDAPGFLGDSMLIQADGRHVFFNAVGDSIFFLPDFTWGDSWPFYRYNDGTGNWIEAVAFQLATTALIPGYRDSIKVVQLIGRLPGGAPRPSDPYHATFMGLTESNGFFRGFRLPEVPDTPTTLNHQWRGITNPDTGFSHLDRRRVFDLQPGNERHYRRFTREGEPGLAIETEERYRYLTAGRRFSPDGDTLVLDTYRAMVRTVFVQEFGTNDTVRILDTIEERIPLKDFAFLDAFPFEAHRSRIDGTPTDGYSIQYWDTNFFNRSFKEVYNHFTLNEGVPCLEPNSGPLPEWTFIQGLGLFHYATAPADDPGFAREEIDMVYYQKDLDVWGEPYDFETLLASGLPGASVLLEGLKVYPNPNAGAFWIDGSNIPACLQAASADGMQVRVFNALGQVVLDRSIQNVVERLALTNARPGLHILECRCGEGVRRQRMVLQP